MADADEVVDELAALVRAMAASRGRLNDALKSKRADKSVLELFLRSQLTIAGGHTAFERGAETRRVRLQAEELARAAEASAAAAAAAASLSSSLSSSSTTTAALPPASVAVPASASAAAAGVITASVTSPAEVQEDRALAALALDLRAAHATVASELAAAGERLVLEQIQLARGSVNGRGAA